MITIEQVSWHDNENYLRHIRTLVFIEEQQVPVNMEWDEYDESCIHVLAKIDEKAVATGRLLETGQIGRMAVLMPYRKQGVGSKVLEKLLLIAKSENMKSVFLYSQLNAIDFYKRFGFDDEGGVVDDAGIPHKKMNKQLM